jgi:selT/selW/selH-like putative selenoprotein
LAEKIESSLAAEVELIRASGGKFEVVAAGQEVYSKLATGEFPDEDQLVAELSELAGRS